MIVFLIEHHLSKGEIIAIVWGCLAFCCVCVSLSRFAYLCRKERHAKYAYHLGAVEDMELSEKADKLRKMAAANKSNGFNLKRHIHGDDVELERESFLAQNPEEDWNCPSHARNVVALRPDINPHIRTLHYASIDVGNDERAIEPNDPRIGQPSAPSPHADSGKAESSKNRSAAQHNDSEQRERRAEGQMTELSSLRSSLQSLATKVRSLSNGFPRSTPHARRKVRFFQALLVCGGF